jgi:hypothetical protein
MAIWYLALLIATGQAAKHADLRQDLEVLKGLVSSVVRDTLNRNSCEHDASKLVQESNKVINSVYALFNSKFSNSLVLSDGRSAKMELMSKLIQLTPDFDETGNKFDFYYYAKIICHFLNNLLNWALGTSQPESTENLSKVLLILDIIAKLTDRPDLKKLSSLLIKLEKILVDLAFISAGGVMLPIRVLVLVEDIQALIESFKEFSEEFEWFKQLFEPVLADLDEFSTKATSSENWTCLNSAYQMPMLDGTEATSKENWTWLNSASEDSADKLDEFFTATKNDGFQQKLNDFFMGLGSSVGRDILKRSACKRDVTKLAQKSSNFISSIYALFSPIFHESAFLGDAWSVTQAVKDTTVSCNLLSLYVHLDQLAKMDKNELMSKLLHLTPEFLMIDKFDAYDFGKVLGRFMMSLLDWTLSTPKPEYTGQYSTAPLNIFITIAELTNQPHLNKIVPLLINLNNIRDNLALISACGVMLPYRVLVLVRDIRALYEILKELSEEFDWLKKPIEPVLAKLNEFCTRASLSQNWSFVDKLAEIGAASQNFNSALQISYGKLREIGTAETSSENWSWLNSVLKTSLDKLGEVGTAATSSENWSLLNSALQTSLDKLGEVGAAAASSENWSWFNSALQTSLDKLGEIGTAATSSENWSWLNSASEASADKLGEIDTAESSENCDSSKSQDVCSLG